MRKGFFVAVCAILAGSLAQADDWPQFRGPDRSGVSKEKGLLKAWPKDGPKLAWTFKNAGAGFSSFAIVKGTLYTLGTRGKDEIILALDAKDGKELWTAPIGPIFSYQNFGDGPRSTPTIDGNFLYALGGQAELVCVDITQKGKEIWRKNLIKDLGGELMKVGKDSWGYSESPLIDGANLICTPGGPKGTLAALDKSSGKIRWRSKDTFNAPYSSAVVADFHGVRQYVQTGLANKPGKEHGVVSGYSAKDGAILWSKEIFKGAGSYAIAPSPIVVGTKVYATSGYGGGCHLFEIDKEQKATEKYGKSTWKRVKNTLGGVVLIDGHIYGHSEATMWICQEVATGELKWDERNTLVCKSGATTAADGMLYLYTDDGEVALVEASPKQFNLLGSFKIPVRSTLPQTTPSTSKAMTWTIPVVANGHLFVRDLDLIFAYKVSK